MGRESFANLMILMPSNAKFNIGMENALSRFIIMAYIAILKLVGCC